MFDEKLIEQYKAVQAPKELKSNIIDALDQKEYTQYHKRPVRSIAFACALVFMFIISFNGIKYMSASPSVNLITNEAYGLSLVREVSTIQNVYFELESDYKVSVFVDRGELTDFKTSEIVTSQKKLDGSVILCWSFDINDAENATLTISSPLKKAVYSLALDGNRYLIIER